MYLANDKDEIAVRGILGCSDPPLVVRTGVRFRPFADGGGLCSLGRWRPAERGPLKLNFLTEASMAVIDELGLVDSLQRSARKGFANGEPHGIHTMLL